MKRKMKQADGKVDPFGDASSGATDWPAHTGPSVTVDFGLRIVQHWQKELQKTHSSCRL